jgi:tetratricopeptide (TPR) repeat protein
MKRHLCASLIVLACLLALTLTPAYSQEPAQASNGASKAAPRVAQGAAPSVAQAGGNEAADAASLFSRGKFEYQDQNYKEALGYLKRACELQPGNADYARYLGLTQAALGERAQGATLLAKAAQADPSLPGVWFDLGKTEFEADRYKEAVAALKKAEEREPNRADAYYYHGLALNKLGRYEDAPPLFEKAVGLNSSLGETSYYYMGVAKYRTRDWAAATADFDRAIKYDPESDIADSSRAFLRAITDEPATRPFRLSGSFSFQYDDNVIQQPNSQAFQLASLRKNVGDWSAVFFGSGDWRAIEHKDYYAGLGASLYHNNYFDLDHLDLVGTVLNAYAGWRPRSDLEMRLNCAFTYYWMDYDSYLGTIDVSPTVLWRQTNKLLFQGYFSYKHRNYSNGSWNTGNFPIDGLDANNYSVGFLQYLLPFKGDGNVYIGYRFDREAARAGDFAYSGHQGTLGATSPTICATRAFAEVSYYARAYADPSRYAATPTVRNDGEWNISAGVTHDITRYLQGGFRYLRFDNGSNVIPAGFQSSVFSYARNIYVLSITAVY